MLDGQRIVVVLPAYNAEQTLEKTYREIPRDVVDEVILVDDASNDGTLQKARELGIPHVIRHPQNRGYGGNQKTCYRMALELGADIVVMVHPDYQYTPKLITAMSSLISSGLYDVALGSRVLGGGALKGGMPLYKYVANRALTLIQNLILGEKISEYHTGYRAFSRRVLQTLPLEECSDDFVFDNQMLVQVVQFGFRIAEITCPTVYSPESSSISFFRSVVYGFGVIGATLAHRLSRWGLWHARYLRHDGRRLEITREADLDEREELQRLESLTETAETDISPEEQLEKQREPQAQV